MTLLHIPPAWRNDVHVMSLSSSVNVSLHYSVMYTLSTTIILHSLQQYKLQLQQYTTTVHTKDI